jgi:hypothetical protein
MLGHGHPVTVKGDDQRRRSVEGGVRAGEVPRKIGPAKGTQTSRPDACFSAGRGRPHRPCLPFRDQPDRYQPYDREPDDRAERQLQTDGRHEHVVASRSDQRRAVKRDEGIAADGG